jgi:hypothetical protein
MTASPVRRGRHASGTWAVLAAAVLVSACAPVVTSAAAPSADAMTRGNLRATSPSSNRRVTRLIDFFEDRSPRAPVSSSWSRRRGQAITPPPTRASWSAANSSSSNSLTQGRGAVRVPRPSDVGQAHRPSAIPTGNGQSSWRRFLHGSLFSYPHQRGVSNGKFAW